MLSSFNLRFSPRIGARIIMATKAKTKVGRTAERNSSRSQSSNRNTQGASPSALELLEQDHREVEEWFDEYNEVKEDNDRKGALAEKICWR